MTSRLYHCPYTTMIRIECGDGCLALRTDSKRGACLQKLLKASQYMAALYADEQPDIYVLGAASCQVFLLVLDVLLTPKLDTLPWRQEYEFELVWEAHLLYVSLGLEDVTTWPSSLLIDRCTAQWLAIDPFYPRPPSMSDMRENPWIEATAYAAAMFQRPWEQTGKHEPCKTEEGHCPNHGSRCWCQLYDGWWHEYPNPGVWWTQMTLFARLTLLGRIAVPPNQFSPVALETMLWKMLPTATPAPFLRTYAMSLITYAEQLWPAYRHTNDNHIHRLAWMSSPDTISYELLMHGNKDNDNRIRHSDCHPYFRNNAFAAMKAQPSDAFVQYDEELGAEVLRPFHECICPDAFMEHVTATPRLAAALTRLMTRVSRQRATTEHTNETGRLIRVDGDHAEPFHAGFRQDAKYTYGLLYRSSEALETYELFLNAGALNKLLARTEFIPSTSLFPILCRLQCPEASPLYTATLTRGGLVRVVPSRAGSQERKDHHDESDSDVQSSVLWYYMAATNTVYERRCDLKCDQFATMVARGFHNRVYSAYLRQLKTGTGVCQDEQSTMQRILEKAPKAPDFDMDRVAQRYRSIQAMLERKDVARWVLATVKDEIGTAAGVGEYDWRVQQVTVWR